MNGLKSGIFCMILLFSGVVWGQSNVIDEIVAVVGDEIILRSDIETEYQRQIYGGMQSDGDMKCQILESLLLQKLFIAQAAFDSITVEQEQVLSQVEYQMGYYINELGSVERMEEVFNKTSAEIKEELITVFRNQFITQRMQQEIVKDIRVTPTEVRNFYKSLPQDSLPVIEAQYEVQRIYLKPEVETAEIERVKETLRGYRDRVIQGDDFSTLAILYSQGPSSKQGGGLGFRGRGELMDSYAEVAFGLTEPGQMGKLAETEYGFHLIQLIEKRGNRVNTRHILIKPKSTHEAKEAAKGKLDSLTNLVRKGHMSFEECAYRFSDDESTRNSKGLLSSPQTGAAKFNLTSLSALSPAMAYAVEGLKIGEISDPFLMKNDKEQDVYAVLRLKNKTEEHHVNMQDDYQDIKDMLIAEKNAEAMRKWVVSKREENYISIDDKWVNCQFNFEGWGK